MKGNRSLFGEARLCLSSDAIQGVKVFPSLVQKVSPSSYESSCLITQPKSGQLPTSTLPLSYTLPIIRLMAMSLYTLHRPLHLAHEEMHSSTSLQHRLPTRSRLHRTQVHNATLRHRIIHPTLNPRVQIHIAQIKNRLLAIKSFPLRLTDDLASNYYADFADTGNLRV